MNLINLPQHLIQSIGWTLIHSLWQGLIVYTLLRIALTAFPNKRSDARYTLSVCALGLLTISSVTTFIFLYGPTAGTTAFNIQLIGNAGETSQSASSLLVTTLQWIDNNIIWLIRFWILGFIVGLLRIGSGLWYIDHLRRNSNPVMQHWTDTVTRLSETMNISRVVTIAEASVSSPMVVGFMKPMILFPIGLLTGLTAEQIDTILVHELAHVRRQDYLINLVQAVIESIYFFNPFVLLISSAIRSERENCCDDMVIATGASPLAYVKTLAQLEASRSSSALVLGIGGDKNQLLNRIKRIMEKSAKNDWSKGRLMPVAVLVLGLICVSMLSISSETKLNAPATGSEHNVLASDTAKEKLRKQRNRKHAEVIEVPVVEESDMVPAVEEIPVPDEAFTFSFGPEFAPSFDIDPSLFDVPAMAWDLDSIPDFHFRSNGDDWKVFEEQFTKQFSEKFKEFYEKNQGQIRAMMEEAYRQQHEGMELAETHWKSSADAMRAADQARLAEQMARGFEYDASSVLDVARKMQMESAQIADLARIAERDIQPQFKLMEDQARLQEKMIYEMEDETRQYRDELATMLVEDGYVKKYEAQDNLNINDSNGELTINGIKIKEKDQKKYRELGKKYFNSPRFEQFRRPE